MYQAVIYFFLISQVITKKETWNKYFLTIHWPMKTFFCGHSVGQHVQANRTCQFTLKTSCRNCNFSVIGDGLLWSAVKFVEGKIPWPLHGISSHIQNNNGWNLDPSNPKIDSLFSTFVLSMLLFVSLSMINYVLLFCFSAAHSDARLQYSVLVNTVQVVSAALYFTSP